MKKRSWVVTLVSLITIVGLLLTATPAYAAGPPPEQPGSAKQFRDANKNKIFDNLETRMAPAGMQQPFGVIVQFNKPLGEIDFPALKHQGGPFSVKYEYPSVNAISTTFTKGQIIAAAKHDLVKQIEYNGEVHAFLDTATLWFGVQKARTDFADFGVDGDADDDSTSYSADDLVIAVLDTGIDAAHVGLDGGKVIGWVDFVGGQAVPYDDHGHGTHVASIAAGTGEASDDGSYTGVAPGAALVVVKTLDSSASGTWEDANAGIHWVIDNKLRTEGTPGGDAPDYGIEVMNISWGAGGSSDGSSVTEQLVNEAVALGIVAAVSAGNDGPETYTIGVPAAAAKAITVGAMADVGEGGFFQALFSSRGPTADGRIKPDISSPGWNVMAAKSNSPDGDGYTEMSGTSMATPFLAGVAALMLDANSNLLPNDVKTKFMDTAVDWGPSGPDIDYGAGRLDAYGAISSAGGFTGTGPTAPNHEYVTDSLGGKNKIDWWDINIASTDYPIAITMIMPDWASWKHPDFDMILYDPNGESVSSAFIERQETIAYQPSVTGTYKLKVWSYAGNGPYFFDLSAGTEAPAPTGVPSVSITSPADGSAFHVNDSVLFEGTASDTENGDVTASLVWTSSIDGQIGTGGSFSATLSEGQHTITASATDSEGNQGSASIGVTIVNDAPVATILQPADGASLDSDATITFEGTASDTEDGDVTASLFWTSSIDGQIGAGGSFSATLSDGNHTITAEAADSEGKTGSSSISITVGAPSEPTTVSVSSITYATEGGKNNDRHLLITVALVDDLGNPVAGASVSIDVYRNKALYGSGTGTTGTDGTVTFKLTNAPSGPYTTTVTDVTVEGLTWHGATPENSFDKET